MKRQSIRAILIVGYLVLVTGIAGGETPATSSEILDRIYEHVSQFEKNFPSRYLRRVMTTREYDPDNGKLEKTSIAEQEVWTRVGELPRIKVLSCTIDGKTAELEECQGRESAREPLYRVFGPDGRKHYRLEFTDERPEGDASIYRVRVVPLERTKRHFEGEFTFRSDTLALLRTQGTMADYPMGLKNFELKLDFDELDGLPVIATTRMEMTIYVPLIINRRVVSESVASDQRFLAP